jgi:Na+/H+ antiporter NhaD/arsenite permease-like protein
MSKWIFQAALTTGLVIGGGYVVTRNEQPLEIRLSVAAMVGGAVAWWFRSPLEQKND